MRFNGVGTSCIEFCMIGRDYRVFVWLKFFTLSVFLFGFGWCVV